jgi:hypothetical protein
MKELAGLVNGSCFCEPEEKDWTDAATLRHLSGNFTMISWFRSVRVPQLYRASQLRSAGEVAITDSYYDKLLAYYIGQPGLEWLIDPADPYFDAAVAMAEADWEELPVADVIIFFNVSMEVWRHFLTQHNRFFDLDPKILESYSTQELFYNACKKLAREKHIILMKIDQEWSSPREAAEKVKAALCEKGLIQAK